MEEQRQRQDAMNAAANPDSQPPKAEPSQESEYFVGSCWEFSIRIIIIIQSLVKFKFRKGHYYLSICSHLK